MIESCNSVTRSPHPVALVLLAHVLGLLAQPWADLAEIGVAQLSNVTEGWKELLLNCDRALYAVKSDGGNLVIAEP